MLVYMPYVRGAIDDGTSKPCEIVDFDISYILKWVAILIELHYEH